MFPFLPLFIVIRALVDMLRHQSSPVQQDERNNSVALTVGDGTGTLGRAPKNLYAPGLPSKDNRCEGFKAFTVLMNSTIRGKIRAFVTASSVCWGTSCLPRQYVYASSSSHPEGIFEIIMEKKNPQCKILKVSNLSVNEKRYLWLLYLIILVLYYRD